MTTDEIIFEFERLCAVGQPEDAALFMADKIGTETIVILLARAVSRQLMVQATPQTEKLADAQKAVQAVIGAIDVVVDP